MRLHPLIAATLALGCRKPAAPEGVHDAQAQSGLMRPDAAPRDLVALDTDEAKVMRRNLVQAIRARDAFEDPRVETAMLAVPRHLFVPARIDDALTPAALRVAYNDSPFPIGHGQTISQPTIVAMMTDALELRGGERVLEIGTGSGYQAAVLSGLVREVYSIEIVEPLARRAAERLAELGYRNVTVRAGDGYKGWPEQAPFDRVIVTAAPPEIPKALLDQLADGGILVAPVGEDMQRLERHRKRTKGDVAVEVLAPVRFVPMVPGR